MNILICAKHLHGGGGQERDLRLIATSLKQRGHGVEYICCGKAFDSRNIPTLRFALSKRWGHALWDFMAARKINREMRGMTYDVSLGGTKMWDCDVLRPGGGVEAEYWNLKMTARYRNPYVRKFFTTLSLKRRLDLRAERNGFFSPRLKTIIAISELVKNHILTHYPELESKIEVVYTGIDTYRFTPENDTSQRTEIMTQIGLNPKCLTGIFSGYDFVRKGLKYAIRVIERINATNRQCQLVILGGKPKSNLVSQIKKVGLENKIRFIGSVENPEDYIRVCDFFIFPSEYDPGGNVVLEALACGVPVITNTRVGDAELVTHGHNGWVVNSPDSIDEMAGFVNRLYDPDTLRTMRQNAAATGQCHTLENYISRVEDILCNAVAQ